jgi:hypothetical protein
MGGDRYEYPSSALGVHRCHHNNTIIAEGGTWDMSEDSEAFIREIEEEVRREKLTTLWNTYGKWAIGCLAAFVLLVAGWQWYSAFKVDQAQKAGAQFEEAIAQLEGDNKKDGLALLELLTKEGSPAHATLARLQLAAVYRKAGEMDKAAALYMAVADDTTADQLLRSFAKLQNATLKVDNGTWTDTKNRLNDLANDVSPWRYTARELLGLAAFKHKKWSEAKEAYSNLLADTGAPPTIKQRAQMALALITREEAATAQQGAVKPDLKIDKSAGNDGKSTAEAGEKKPTPEPSDGDGATNDAVKKK